MGIFDHYNLTPEEIAVYANIANASYDKNLPPNLWNEVKGPELGFNTGIFDTIAGVTTGTYIGNTYRGGLLFGFAPAARVYRNGQALAISFRGTDNERDFRLRDFSTYIDITGDEIIRRIFSRNGSYLNAFNPLFRAVQDYADKEGITEIVITGHSLGAAAANMLNEVKSTDYSGFFEDATFVTFASPRISPFPSVLNIGFENDGIFRIISRLTPFEHSAEVNTTNNLIWYNDQYGKKNIFGLPDDVLGLSAHDMENYIVATHQIKGSIFYEQLDRSSIVVLVATDNAVSGEGLSASDHYGKDTYFIGRSLSDYKDLPLLKNGERRKIPFNDADWIIGGRGNDSIYGADGSDTLSGSRGNDEIDGGNGIDRALFSGNCHEYDLTRRSDGSIAINHTRASEGIGDGLDILRNVEIAEFSDISIDLTRNDLSCEGLSLVVNVATQLDVNSSDFLDILCGKASLNVTSATPELIVIDYGGGTRNEYFGSGFTFDGSAVTSGAVTGADIYTNDQLEVSFRGEQSLDAVQFWEFNRRDDALGLLKYVLSGNDSISGGEYADVLNGFDGNDIISSGGGNDTLSGGNGDDLFILTPNASGLVFGGGGYDTVRFNVNQSEVGEISRRGNAIIVGGNTLTQIEALEFEDTSYKLADDFKAGAGTNGRILVDDSVQGEISPGTIDTDSFRVVLSGGETYQIDLVDIPNVGKPNESSLFVQFYRQKKLIVGSVNEYVPVFRSGESASFTERLFITAPSSGEYYIDVGTRQSTPTNYELSLTNVSAEDQFGGDITTVGRLDVNGEFQAGTINYPGDRDYFATRFEAGKRYLIRVEGRDTIEAKLDLVNPVLYGIVDSNNSRVAQTVDENGVGTNALLEFSPETSGTFYLDVGGDEGTTGTYRLSINEMPLDTAGTTSANAFLAVGQSHNNNIEFFADQELIRTAFQADYSNTIDAEAVSFGTEPALLDTPTINLFNSAGTSLVPKIEIPGDGNNEKRFFEPVSQGDYFIVTSDEGNDDLGAYRVTVRTQVTPERSLTLPAQTHQFAGSGSQLAFTQTPITSITSLPPDSIIRSPVIA